MPSLPFVTSLLSVTTNPVAGPVGFDQSILVTLTFSGPVTVTGGPPTLTLDDGGIATFDPARSSATALVFADTVALGENTTALNVVSTNTNAAAIVDGSGNPVSLAGAVGALAGTVQVDTTPPAVLAVSTNPYAGNLAAGATISFTFDMSEATLIAGGTPVLSLNDGGLAIFDPTSSSATHLVFTHLIQAGENVGRLGVSGVALAGASIADAVGNASLFADAMIPAAGSIQVDTTSPSIASVGMATVGGLLAVTLAVSEPVAVVGGAPVLTLSDGAPAIFDPATSTSTALVFLQTVPQGVDLSGLTVTGISLAGASIADGAGNALLTSGALGVVAASPAATISSASPAQASGGVGTAQGESSVAVTDRTIGVYRFFDTATGTHFYTSDPGEEQTILATRPDLVAEGIGLRAIDPSSGDPAASPVFRFFDRVKGTQFLTASAAERDTVLATRPDLAYEPASSMFEHSRPQAGDTPVYRFFDSRYGTHFYTDDAGERANIIASRPDLIAEGIGFYEPAKG